MTRNGKSSSKRAGRDMVIITVNGDNDAVATHGGKATVSISQAAQNDWKAWCARIEREIKAIKDLTAEDKSMLNQSVEQVVSEAKKGEKANPSRIERLFNTIGAMAPDILDVIIATVANPLAGLGLVAKKVGDKAKVTKKE